MATELRPYHEMAQRFCDDVVLLAGCFKPNARGRWELSGLRALSERQLLKGRGAYFAERILVAVTPLEVVAIAMDSAMLRRSRRLVWARPELQVQTVASRIEYEGLGPAVFLSRAGGSPFLEIAPLVDDAASTAVVDDLIGGRPDFDRI